MTQTQRNLGLFAGVALLFILTGVFQSWNLSLQILNIGILSAIMALGVIMQWGYAGLFSTGIVGSIALGGLAVVFVSGNPVPEAFAAGGWQAISGLAVAVAGIAAAVAARSSADNRVNCRVLRISLPLGYCAKTRLHEARVAPACFSPATPSRLATSSVCAVEARPAPTKPSQVIVPMKSVGFKTVIAGPFCQKPPARLAA